MGDGGVGRGRMGGGDGVSGSGSVSYGMTKHGLRDATSLPTLHNTKTGHAVHDRYLDTQTVH